MDERRIYNELLVLRCQRGDPGAMEELVRRWERQIFYYIRGLVNEEQDTWDVLQETWLRVVRDIGTLRDPKALATWLYTIARHRAFIHIRSTIRDRQRLECEDSLESVAADEDFSFEDADAINSALGKLTLAHREVLILFFMEDLSIDEIAEVLGSPTGTIKSRLHFAKRALRAVLRQEGIG